MTGPLNRAFQLVFCFGVDASELSFSKKKVALAGDAAPDDRGARTLYMSRHELRTQSLKNLWFTYLIRDPTSTSKLEYVGMSVCKSNDAAVSGATFMGG